MWCPSQAQQVNNGPHAPRASASSATSKAFSLLMASAIVLTPHDHFHGERRCNPINPILIPGHPPLHRQKSQMLSLPRMPPPLQCRSRFEDLRRCISFLCRTVLVHLGRSGCQVILLVDSMHTARKVKTGTKAVQSSLSILGNGVPRVGFAPIVLKPRI